MTLIPFDLKDAAAFEPLGHAIAEKFGRLDGLLGNAGVLGHIGPLQAGGERQNADHQRDDQQYEGPALAT